jgi:HEAT repeat protein
MGLFGPPNVEKLKAKKDIEGLIKALNYRKDYWNENVYCDRSLREDVNRVGSVRAAAALAIGEIGDPRGVTPLLEALNDKVFEVRKATVEALAMIGKPAVKELLVELGKESYPNRSDVIKALGMIGDPLAVEPLILELGSSRWGIPRDAASALGELGDKRAIEPLRTLLMEKDEVVRNAATHALDKLGWKPDQPEDKIAYWLQKGDVNQCAKLGTIAVGFLINALKNEDTLETAAAALGQIGATQAVEPLVEALKAEKQSSRMAAVKALGMLGDNRAVEPLLDAIRNEPQIFCRMNRRSYLTDVEIRRAEPLKRAAVTALIQIGESAIKPLLILLKDEHAREYSALIQEVLSSIGTPAVKPLIATLKHSNKYVRQDAMKTLVKIGQPSIQPVTDLLLSKESDLREIAAATLDKLKWQPSQDSKGAAYYIVNQQWKPCIDIGTPAVEPLIFALKDQDEKVRQKVVHALGQIGDLRAINPLIAASKDQEPQVRYEALEVLGKIGGAQVLDVLIHALKDKHFRVRYTAVETLAEIGDARAVEPIIECLQDKDTLVSKASAWALGDLNDPRAVEPLIALLERKNTDSDVRHAAAWSLVELYTSACAVEALIALLDSKNVDSDVRREAARSLVALYTSTSLDDLQKQTILASRSTIVGTSKPHTDEHTDWGSGCYGNSHSDSPAIKVEFPL